MKQKSWIGKILVPLVVALISSMSTYFITQQQVQSAEKINEAQIFSTSEIADSDRQIKLLGIFSKHIISGNKKEQQIALEVLEAMDDGDLTKKLATIVTESEPNDTKIKEFAQGVAETSLKKGYWFAVIGSHRKIKDAKDMAEKLPKSNKYTPEIYRSWNFYYAVTLGGYLSRSEADKRVNYAKENIAADAYLHKTRIWGKKLVN